MRARELIEAMGRRSFLKRLGLGVAGIAANPKLALPQAAPVAAAATDYFDETDELQAAWAAFEQRLSDIAINDQQMVAPLTRVYKMADNWTDVWDEAQDQIYNAYQDGARGEELAQVAEETADNFAVNAQDWFENTVLYRRSDLNLKRRERADRQFKSEWDQRQRAKQQKGRWGQPKSVYTSRKGSQDRRGVDEPSIPYQGRPRFGEAAAIVDALLA